MQNIRTKYFVNKKEAIMNNIEISEELILKCTTQIVSAYLSANKIDPESIPSLITSVQKTLSGSQSNTIDKSQDKLKPAVNISKSINDDYIICLEDGKKLKMLKRYIRSNFNMTPEDYRKRWGLPNDYPMVAPNYAERRSNFAKQIGLGRAPKVKI